MALLLCIMHKVYCILKNITNWLVDYCNLHHSHVYYKHDSSCGTGASGQTHTGPHTVSQAVKPREKCTICLKPLSSSRSFTQCALSGLTRTRTVKRSRSSTR